MKKEYLSSNLVFLDFDGVLTSIEDGTSYKLMDDLTYRPSKNLIAKLKGLLDSTNSKIVLTTNWRKFKAGQDWMYMGIRMPNPMTKLKRALSGYIVDSIPFDRSRHGVRKADYLVEWFEKNPGFTGNFVIFDDVDYEKFSEKTEYGIKDRFIQTDDFTGLSDNNVEDASKMLLE